MFYSPSNSIVQWRLDVLILIRLEIADDLKKFYEYEYKYSYISKHPKAMNRILEPTIELFTANHGFCVIFAG